MIFCVFNFPIPTKNIILYCFSFAATFGAFFGIMETIIMHCNSMRTELGHLAGFRFLSCCILQTVFRE